MFAVIRTGGKQYRVAVGDLVEIGKVGGEAGDRLAFEDVLMLGGGARVTLGTPRVEGAHVQGELVRQFRADKVIAFKKRRRKHSSATKRGHRQPLSLVRIAEIVDPAALPERDAGTAGEPAERLPESAKPPLAETACAEGRQIEGSASQEKDHGA